MSRNNFQIKKSVPLKVKGFARNPFGENVIINRDEYYGVKERQLIPRNSAESGVQQLQKPEKERKDRKSAIDGAVRGLSQNKNAINQGDVDDGLYQNGDNIPQTAPHRINHRFARIGSQVSPENIRSEVTTSKGKKIQNPIKFKIGRNPNLEEDVSAELIEKNGQQNEAGNIQLQEDITAMGNLSPQNKKSESPSPLKRISASYEEGYNISGADTGSAPESSDQKKKFDFQGDQSLKKDPRFENTGMKTTVRGSFMNEHIPQSELQKREEQKKQMKEALEMQMNEKKRKKEEAKRQEIEDYKREEERLRKENEELNRQAELEKEAIYQKTQARFMQMSQLSHPSNKNSQPEQKQTVEKVDKPERIERVERVEKNTRLQEQRPSVPIETEKIKHPIYIKPESEPKKLSGEVPHEKLIKLEEDNMKLKEENTKQGEIIDLLLNVFKVKNPEQLSGSKLLSEVSEFRSKQLQGSTIQQKSALIPKTNQFPFQEEPNREDHQYIDVKNHYKMDHSQNPNIQHPTDYVPLSADEIGYRYLKSSEDSSIYRSNQKFGILKPPIGPRTNHHVGKDTISSRNHFVDQVPPHPSYMNGFDHMRQPNENPFRIYSSPTQTSNVKQSFVLNSLMGLQNAQKERLFINQPPFIASATNSVYQTPSQRWEGEGGTFESRPFGLKQSRSDVKFPREQSGFEGYDRFQLPVSEQYQRNAVSNQHRGLPVHSNKMPMYNSGVYKPPSIVSEFSVKFPMDVLRQNPITSAFTGMNTVPTFDEANGYLNNRPIGMNPPIYNGNKEFSADYYTGPRRDPNAFEPSYKFPRQQNEMPAQRNLPDYSQMGGMNSEDRNQIPKFPKDIFNIGLKKKPIN